MGLMVAQNLANEDLIVLYERSIQLLSKHIEFPQVQEIINTIKFAVLCMKHPDKAQNLAKM
ncbi:hypothetical protein TC41_2511 [Alicyclobacillus acidocaldarius subsp. acidocaldarius Tc-4-1]|uniref:Uncharacterized protein n=2 Tax=Alicyclobacillus acidocaldarius TaxID=405212 RepID=F8IHD6_ALIAT|nr:hypothetical protein TC41_2511 [Alicyclobacillus acidocaldarius subsp. acidocaldarius Tc-4-1]